MRTRITRCEHIVGYTLFEIADKTDADFKEIVFPNGDMHKLEYVHYKRIDPEIEKPRQFAVRGTYNLLGEEIALVA